MLLFVRNIIRRRKTSGAGHVVLEVPGLESSVLVRGATHIDNAGRPQVGPSKLFLAAPDQLHRFPGCSGQPGSFDRTFPVVLASITRPGVRHNDPDLRLWKSQGAREFASHAKRALSTRPNRQLIALKFGY